MWFGGGAASAGGVGTFVDKWRWEWVWLFCWGLFGFTVRRLLEPAWVINAAGNLVGNQPGQPTNNVIMRGAGSYQPEVELSSIC